LQVVTKARTIVIEYSGFGSALIAMPIIIQLIGLSVAAPTFALVAQTAGVIVLLRYRQNLDPRRVWRLLAASLVAIPISIQVAQALPQQLAMMGLGIFMLVYAVYALVVPHMPELKNPRWGYVFGFANGLLHGAYNTGGPPLVIYGSAARWQPADFKSNLQTVFLINGMLVIATHLLKGSITVQVLHYYAIMLPGVFIGLIGGFALDRYISPERFRRAILVMLIILGLTLIF
jgi:uncharacterized membrane protein YfcA